MRATNQSNEMGAVIEMKDKMAVDTKTLQVMVGVGRKSAVEIGTASGAKIQIGRRILWNTRKVQRYLDAMSE
ncbi:MAG: hypothetical protein PUE12_16745 [Oscillospiraceae bacterium]|nr:hypothetical protein [Oscillospiraceae bacterium]